MVFFYILKLHPPLTLREFRENVTETLSRSYSQYVTRAVPPRLRKDCTPLRWSVVTEALHRMSWPMTKHQIRYCATETPTRILRTLPERIRAIISKLGGSAALPHHDTPLYPHTALALARSNH